MEKYTHKTNYKPLRAIFLVGVMLFIIGFLSVNVHAELNVHGYVFDSTTSPSARNGMEIVMNYSGTINQIINLTIKQVVKKS